MIPQHPGTASQFINMAILTELQGNILKTEPHIWKFSILWGKNVGFLKFIGIMENYVMKTIIKMTAQWSDYKGYIIVRVV